MGCNQFASQDFRKSQVAAGQNSSNPLIRPAELCGGVAGGKTHRLNSSSYGGRAGGKPHASHNTCVHFHQHANANESSTESESPLQISDSGADTFHSGLPKISAAMEPEFFSTAELNSAKSFKFGLSRSSCHNIQSNGDLPLANTGIAGLSEKGFDKYSIINLSSPKAVELMDFKISQCPPGKGCPGVTGSIHSLGANFSETDFSPRDAPFSLSHSLSCRSLAGDSSLSDITLSELSLSFTEPLRGTVLDAHEHSNNLFKADTECLECQHSGSSLSIDFDLFVYDDLVISKEARMKHWRLAGRKPALADCNADDRTTQTSTTAHFRSSPTTEVLGVKVSSKRNSKSRANYFSFNDFNVCVDEMDMNLLTGESATARRVSGGLSASPPAPLPAAPTSSSASALPLATAATTPTAAAITTTTTTFSQAGSSDAVLFPQSSILGALADLTTDAAGGARGRAPKSPSHGTTTTTTTTITITSSSSTSTVSTCRWLSLLYGPAQRPGVSRPLRRFSCTTFLGHASRVKSMALSPNEREFVSCSNEDASVSLYSMTVRAEVGIFTGHQDNVISTSFSSDGKYLATTSKDKTMILWDVMTTKRMLTFKHAKVVICCCFSPDSKYVVSGCQDRSCRLWDTSHGKEWLCYSQHRGIIISVAFSPCGSYVCSSSADRTVHVWSATSAKTRFVLVGHRGIILSCNYTSNGKYIISNDEASLKVWRAEDGSCVMSLSPTDVAGPMAPPGHGANGHIKLVWTLSCNAPGNFTNYCIVACSNRFVYVIDIETGKEVASTFSRAPVYCLTVGNNETSAFGDAFGNIYLLHIE